MSKPRFSVIALAMASSLAISAVSAAPLTNTQLDRMAASEHRGGELLVKFKDSVNASDADRDALALGAEEVKHFREVKRAKNNRMTNWRSVRLRPGTSFREALKRFSEHPNVELVEPNYLYHAVTTPNDTRYPEMWWLNNIGQTGGTTDADIDAPEAWDIATGDASIIVGVVDTGIDYTHPDLAANVWVNPGEIAGDGIDNDGNGFVDDVHGYDFVNNDGDPFDDNEHGTHVSGTIGAVTNNGLGVAGVAWNVQVMGLKFLDRNGSGSTTDAIDAILYGVDMGADILSNSWGGGGFSSSLEASIQTAESAGVLFVAAAGNGDARGRPIDNDANPQYPASYPEANIISVAATDHNDAMASFSNFGATSVDLAAPGVSILSTIPGNQYALFSGTSMATPHVSGAAVVLLGNDPTLTVSQLKAKILDNVDVLPQLSGLMVTGGRLNLANALGATTPPPTDNLPPIADAGPDLVATARTTISIDGSGSSDPDGTIVSYSWAHISSGRRTLRLADPNNAILTVRMPGVRRTTDLVFELTVTDDAGATATDTVTVTVNP